MSEERRRILDMLAAGKISAEEAERLMDKLGMKTEGEHTRSSSTGSAATAVAVTSGTRQAPLKYLRILVDSADGDQVNIRVPLGLVRTGVKLTTMLPTEVSEKLSRQGIDLSHLSQLKGEELIEALRELKIDVDSTKGDKVRIFCE